MTLLFCCLGHYLGMDVHDCSMVSYDRPLKPGVVSVLPYTDHYFLCISFVSFFFLFHTASMFLPYMSTIVILGCECWNIYDCFNVFLI